MSAVPQTERPAAWWLATLKRRAQRQSDEYVDLSQPITWPSPEAQRAAIKFFNAAFRAEESGLRQAHELAHEVASWDPELAEVLRLYGNEEGWHRELLTEFLDYIGGRVEPMGRVTRTLYSVYARAHRMESIVLTNLMFECIGSTTYRLTLGRVEHPALRKMLTILTRDEAFHVPLNVFFLRQVLARSGRLEKLRVEYLYKLLFLALVLLPIASRRKALAFDGIPTLELMRAYARALGGLFPEGSFPKGSHLSMRPPRLALWALGLRSRDLQGDELLQIGMDAAERAADRDQVAVRGLDFKNAP
ncbi:MAG TPA: ferritin-like domain-containing protein [Polyangiaceae bacterium]|nr:ferritin-like domain-containing protein [Polyangiaceae bacterium]